MWYFSGLFQRVFDDDELDDDDDCHDREALPRCQDHGLESARQEDILRAHAISTAQEHSFLR